MGKIKKHRCIRGKETTKLRVLAIAMMLHYDQIISAAQIVRTLENRYGITCDRKSIYSDIYAINQLIPIESIPGRHGGYRRVDVIRRCENEKS